MTKTVDDLNRVEQEREWYVAKSNELIQRSRYSLPITQQRILLYLISKIKPQDAGDETYTLSVQEFCNVVGIDCTGGIYYTKIKDIVRELGNSQGFIEYIGDDGRKHERPFTWLSHDKTDICQGSGTITVGFSQALKPHLFELRRRYTQIRFFELAQLKSKYAIRLYELLRSYAPSAKLENGEVIDKAFSVTEIKQRIDAEGYSRYYDLRKRALIPAIDEINTCSQEMHVDFEEHKQGNAIKSVMFTVSYPCAKQMLLARAEKRKRQEHRSY